MSDAWPGVEYNFAPISAISADEPLIPASGITLFGASASWRPGRRAFSFIRSSRVERSGGESVEA